MKIQYYFLLILIFVLNSCQSKTTRIETSSSSKICCTDSSQSCSPQKQNKSTITIPALCSQGEIMVFYFHNQRRCATCMAVEEGAAEVVKQFADSSIIFKSFNIGDPKSSDEEKKYDIQGQALLIIGKRQILDITNMAFLNALAKPDYYKSEIKKQIEKLK